MDARQEEIKKIETILRNGSWKFSDIARNLVDKGIRSKEGFEIVDEPHMEGRSYDVWIEAIDYKEDTE